MNDTPNGEMQMFAVKEIWNNAICLYFRIRGADKVYGCSAVEWIEMTPTLHASEPFPYVSLKLGATSAQALMDSLWDCGVRPTEGTGSAGQSSAQQAHIRDLEKVVDGFLGVVQRGTL